MEQPFNLCIIKPNKNAFSETFVQEHINRLPGNKKVLYGGAFPVYDDEGKYIIRSKLGLLSYLIQKKIFKKKEIGVRTRALTRYLKEQKTDVVLAEYGMVGAMVTEACRKANVPLLIHFHGADAHHKQTLALYYDRYQNAFEYASAIIAVSNDMVEALRKMGAPINKIILNPYGVDTVLFEQIDIKRSSINYISVGRFVAKKSPMSVVKAFQFVLKKYPEARLWMVGNGPLYDEVKKFIVDNALTDRITLTGVLSSVDIQKLFLKMRCFVQHSVTSVDGDMEGTPNTILEAGSSGLAIVSTLHAGIKEAVIDGVTGYLVPEHEIEAMAYYMMKIAGDVELAAELGAREAEHIRKNYDIRDRINTLTEVLYKAMNRN